MNALLGPFEKRGEEFADLTHETLVNIRDSSYNVRVRLDDWSRQLDGVVADIEWFSGELQPLVVNAREGVDDAGVLFKRGNEFLDTNRASIEESIASIRRSLGTIEDETLPQYTGLASDARERIERLDPTIDDIEGFVRAELIPNLRRSLGNATVASAFLKHAIAEIRDQPWRLLIRPTKKDLGEQLIYDAARTYAGAVSDLRAASEALAISLESPELRDDPDRLREMAQHLDDAFSQYEQAERDLLSRMIGSGE